jgi:hypothetical protein
MDLLALAERNCRDTEQRPASVPTRRIILCSEILRKRAKEPLGDLI